jgi:hypothetical protein
VALHPVQLVSTLVVAGEMEKAALEEYAVPAAAPHPDRAISRGEINPEPSRISAIRPTGARSAGTRFVAGVGWRTVVEGSSAGERFVGFDAPRRLRSS